MKTRARRRELLCAGLTAFSAFSFPGTLVAQQNAERPRFQRIPVKYIAALGNSGATQGNNAHEWGIWHVDPGPRGVMLADYDQLLANGGRAPAGWQFDSADWWLEEHGLIMEQPEFPLAAGHYLVTGGREKTAMLSVDPPSADGSRHWQLDDDANIHDVTHLRCRSGRYRSADAGSACSPALASQQDFPVSPGAAMPDVSGCQRLDYQVLIVYAIADY